jgi:predicted amino acid-binding ACT domain protein
MEEIIEAKRSLGNGRWDKILKRKMVELSFADNYEEAKDEWETTGKVYKHTHYGQQPDWAEETGHLGYCLCGRNIAYHFQVENTVTGVKEVVGSDHIGSYLIIRQIMKNTNLRQEDITDAMVEDWLKIRIQTMKSDAWWEENGEHFNEMFEAIQQLDARINVKNKQYSTRGGGLNTEYYMYSNLMTRAKGKFGDYGYQMASIVWRWNHVDNPKNQVTKYGYPNDRLWADLNLFYALRVVHQATVDKEDEGLAKYTERLAEQNRLKAKRAEEYREKRRLANLAWEAGREERERLAEQQRIEEEKQRRIRAIEKKKQALVILERADETFEEMKDYYGFPDYDVNKLQSHEITSLATIKDMLALGQVLLPAHLNALRRIFNKSNPAG